MIHLTDEIAIAADQYQYIVGKPKERHDKDGAAMIEMIHPRYYSSLDAAVSEAIAQALRNKVARSEIVSLQQYLDAIQSVSQYFKKAVQSLIV